MKIHTPPRIFPPLHRPVTQTEYEALAAFRYGLRCFLRFSEQQANAEGLTAKQHQALLAIKGFPDREILTIGQLSERLQIQHNSAVGLVNRLVAEDLVMRHHNPMDRREVYVALSPKGLEILERLSAVHKEELRQISTDLNQLVEILTY